MGDSFQTIVPTAVGPDTAETVGTALLDLLVSEGIVAPEISDSILGEGEGHRPGPNYGSAISEPDPLLSRLATNGVCVETGRMVVLDPEGETSWSCGTCGANNEGGQTLFEAISTWHGGDDDAGVICATCSSRTLLGALMSPSPMAFGHVAITFWNWPPLSEELLRRIERRIGSPITLVHGTL